MAVPKTTKTRYRDGSAWARQDIKCQGMHLTYLGVQKHWHRIARCPERLRTQVFAS